jgi:rRNA processing protein Krr1/Pno1
MARTIQFPKAESEGNLIKIEGNQEVVEKIVAAIQEIIAELDSKTTQIVEISTDKHRSLIGRGGETKKDLESKFKVSIDIPRQGSGQSAIKIDGLPANVEKAKIHILDLVKDQEGETIQVPRKFHHTIADNGQFFRKMRNDHQVTVDHAGHKLPPKPMVPTNPRANGTLSLITDDPSEATESWKVISTADSNIDGEIPWILRGSPDSLPKAKAALLAAIEQASKSTHVGYLVLPDPRTYRYVIGQGGNNVNSIRKATGCKITVPRDQAKDEAIEIIGSERGIEEARDLVLKAVKDGVEANGSRV